MVSSPKAAREISDGPLSQTAFDHRHNTPLVPKVGVARRLGNWIRRKRGFMRGGFFGAANWQGADYNRNSILHNTAT
jgi:hypothetical protein